MEPTTSEWIEAFRELKQHPELSRIVLQRNGDWTFVAERKTTPMSNVVANTYYKTKLYNTVIYRWCW
jgi:hypothetical protein